VNTATLVWGRAEAGGRQSVAFDTSTPGALKLVVTGMPASLRWSGANSIAWDSGDPTNAASGAMNWRSGGAADRFVKFDAVTFDDTLTNGTAVLAGAVEPCSVLVSNVTKAVTINAVTGRIVGVTSLLKVGSGSLTLEGTNTYSGGTAIGAGTVQLASDGANACALGSGPVTLKGGTLSMYSNFSSYNHAFWDLVVPASFSGSLNCDSRCYLHGALAGGGTLNLYVPDIRTEFDGDWSAFTGQLNITTDANGGEFRIGNDSVPTGLPDAAVSLGPKVALKYVAIVDAGGETLIELGALSGDASSLLCGGPTTGRMFTWQIGKRNADTTFAGTLAEQSAGCLTALAKIGAGVLRLSGTCSNAGPTTVAGGKLIVNGSVVASPIGVNSGSTLGGSGSVTAVTFKAGSALAPGDSGVGTLTATGPVTLSDTTALNFDIGASCDRVNVAGSLTLGGTLNLNNVGGLAAGSYTLVTYTGALSGSGLTLGSRPADFNYAIDTSTGGQVKLVVTPVLTPFEGWQVLWFGSTAAPEAAASADPDGDGQTNADEYASGTNPTSPASVAMLFWRGDGVSNQWNVAASSNFWNGARLSRFTNGNPVTFDASGSANSTANVSAAVSPSSVSVSNTTAFTFAGAGVLAGTGTLSKAGSGTLNLMIANASSGGLSVSGGTVVVPSSAALGAGPVNVGGSAVALQFSSSASVSNAISLSGGAGQAGYGLVRATGGTVTLGGPITITATPSAGGGHFYQSSGALIVAGVITSSVPVGLRYGSATFAGGGAGYAQLNVNAGTAKLGANNGLATTATIDLGSVSASVLDLAGFSQGLVGVTKSASAATIGNSSTNADSTLTLTGTNTFGGVIKDSLGSGTRKVGLAVSTSGAVTLSGTNTYSGGTTVAGGTLIAAAAGTLGAGRLTVAAGATCVVQNVSGAIANSATVYLSGTLSLAAGVTDTVQRLFLDGVLQRAGVWNAARDPAHFSGAGSLSVADGMPDTPSEAFMSSWTNKLAVTFVNYAPAETLTNFPVLVVLGTNVSGFAYSQFASASGADLRFTDQTQASELSYEIEKWNTNGLSYVWVRVPLLSRSSSLLAHWGNAELAYLPACATNGSTWSEGFVGVWHLSETNGQHRDSSPSRTQSELVQVTAQGTAAGVASGCDTFDGVNDYVDLPNMGTQAQVTVECWANLAAVPLAADIGLVSSDPWTAGVMHFKTSTNLQVKAQINGAGAVTSANNLLSVGSWFYAAYTVAGSGANSLKSYCNAALIGSSSGATSNNLTDVNIAREYNGRYLSARVDEVRISSVARSQAWLWATCQNLMSNAVFNSYGSAGLLASNRPPALAGVASCATGAGQWLSVTNSAADPDLPLQVLTFSLLNAPSGITVNADSGLISWRPSVAQAGTYNAMKVVVADNGWPVASATQTFSVTVNPVAQPVVAQPQFVSGKLYLGVTGEDGPDYAVLASTNLVDWSTVYTTNSPVLPFLWTDPDAPLYQSRFYRVLIGP
jgi:autotransporter-associated beta strand protein